MRKHYFAMVGICLVVLTAMLLIITSLCSAGELGFRWDPNTEPDLAGYRIFWGQTSRFSVAAQAVVTAKINEECTANPGAGGVEACKTESAAFCGMPDFACHPFYYGYSAGVDTGNVTQFTLKDLPDGMLYFAIVAMDTASNVSKFSNEVSHQLDGTPPGVVLNFRKTAETQKFRLTIENVQE